MPQGVLCLARAHPLALLAWGREHLQGRQEWGLAREQRQVAVWGLGHLQVHPEWGPGPEHQDRLEWGPGLQACPLALLVSVLALVAAWMVRWGLGRFLARGCPGIAHCRSPAPAMQLPHGDMHTPTIDSCQGSSVVKLTNNDQE